MRETTIFQRVMRIIGLSVLTILFLDCFDTLQVQEQQKVNVLFTVVDSTARTTLPQASLSSVASYKLLGGKDGAAEIILLESFIGTGTTVALDPGTWNFTLNAYNDTGENILYGKVNNKQINLSGNNQVSFLLSVINNGMGSIQITLIFPEAAGITRISTTGDVGSESFNPVTSGNFVYSKDRIPSGDYFINFELYLGNVLRAVVSELVLVRNGLTSSKTITLVGEDLKPIYLAGTVTINPVVSVTIGEELTATYSGTETVTYQWKKDGLSIANATEAKYTPNSSGIYTVTVSAAGYSNSLTSVAIAVVGHAATVPGSSLQAKLVWLANIAESNNNYILEVSEDEAIPSFNLSYSGKSNIVITLVSTGSLHTISLSDNYLDTMFTIGAGVILVLENNITLQRPNNNSGKLVSVNGTFVMNVGSALSRGNVNVASNGTFTMYGGTISGNTFSFSSSSSSDYYSCNGGVNVAGGTFTMYGGTISGNIFTSSSYGSYTSYGGGVYVVDGNFTMNGGTISGNTFSSSSSSSYSSKSYGRGVCVNGGSFTMSGGTISNNTFSSSSSDSHTSYGGGVYVVYGSFTMSGGIISGNISSCYSSSNYENIIGGGGGVYVDSNGSFTMNGGIISNNISSSSSYGSNGGGVYVADGIFTMNDGKISDNTVSASVTSSYSFSRSSGGGVYVAGGTFIMNDGEISDNTVSASNSSSSYASVSYGGGVNVARGTFIMNDGEISDNTASAFNSSSSNSYTSYGGGVYIDYGTFTMNGGTISGNTATRGGGVSGTLTMNRGTISGNTATSGGGLYGTLTMNGGTISGNTATTSGGGVCVTTSGTFAKTGGTIYGYTFGNSNDNTVKNNSGTILSNKGHAVWVDYNVITIHKETTAGPDVNLSWNGTINPPIFSGGWEY